MIEASPQLARIFAPALKGLAWQAACDRLRIALGPECAPKQLEKLTDWSLYGAPTRSQGMAAHQWRI
jgi:hypothetical protein